MLPQRERFIHNDTTMPLRRRHLCALPLATLVLRSPLAAATSADPASATHVWPAKEWGRVPPEQAGWSVDALARAQAYSESIGSTSVMAVHHGSVVASWGAIDHRIDLHSVRKSLLSALIGIAVTQGKIDLNASLGALRINDVPPTLTDIEKQATVRQLLQSRSGVYHPALYETSGEKRLRPARGSHAPGSFWYYNNWDFNALGTIYEQSVGTSIYEGFRTLIAEPTGMQDYRVGDGRYVRGIDSEHPAYLFRMSARDLARFGLLFLRAGQWQGRSIVPAAWVRESTTAWSETSIHSGYGYLWWTGFANRGVAIMDLPPGGFWADGHNGQFVVVDPTHDLVVVHQTATGKIGPQQMGRVMWLLLVAAGVADPGTDPMLERGKAS